MDWVTVVFVLLAAVFLPLRFVKGTLLGVVTLVTTRKWLEGKPTATFLVVALLVCGVAYDMWGIYEALHR